MWKSKLYTKGRCKSKKRGSQNRWRWLLEDAMSEAITKGLGGKKNIQ